MSEYIITDEQIAENRRLHGKKLLVMPEIVRCRDCWEYNPELYRHISCELLGRYVEPDDFCSWSCRRSDKE